MRLALVIDQPFWFNGRVYSTNAPFINFALSFVDVVDELLLFVPLTFSLSEEGLYRFKSCPKVKFIALPFFKTATEMYFSFFQLIPQMYGIFKKEVACWDVAWLVGEHVPSILFKQVADGEGKKTFFYLRSNLIKEIESHQYRGIKAFLAKGTVRFFNARVRKHLKSGTPAFVTGDELYSLYHAPGTQVYKVYPTLITENDILSRRSDRAGGFTIIAVGRLTPEKGLDVLIDAVGILVARGMELTCQIVGSGKEEPNIRSRVRKLGLEHYIKFAGFVSPGKDLYSQYDAADVYVLSSYTEGLPKTIYEAMARGLPVVSTNVGGIAEIVIDGKNGLLVPSGDAEALAGAIRRLAGDPELRRSCSVANLERVKEFTLEKQRDRMFAIIQKHIAVGQQGDVQC